ncbi:MAG: hypothetical protein LIP77_10655 [Planctomycetes bacterium]|nr:hypothetical protein [Planctomycetota bacterium]
MSTDPRQPTKSPHRRVPEEDDGFDASIVAEQIEAGYDFQADAAVMPMVDDPASSSLYDEEEAEKV